MLYELFSTSRTEHFVCLNYVVRFVTWCLLCYLERHVDVVNNVVSMLLL